MTRVKLAPLERAESLLRQRGHSDEADAVRAVLELLERAEGL